MVIKHTDIQPTLLIAPVLKTRISFLLIFDNNITMKKKCNGIAMIEVLISIGLIALVLLSLLSYQIDMLASIEETHFQNIASSQIMNFAEMLLVNKTDGMRHKALSAWNKDNQHLLPEGAGNFSDVGSHICDITLSWFFKKQTSLSVETFC